MMAESLWERRVVVPVVSRVRMFQDEICMLCYMCSLLPISHCPLFEARIPNRWRAIQLKSLVGIIIIEGFTWPDSLMQDSQAVGLSLHLDNQPCGILAHWHGRSGTGASWAEMIARMWLLVISKWLHGAICEGWMRQMDWCSKPPKQGARMWLPHYKHTTNLPHPMPYLISIKLWLTIQLYSAYSTGKNNYTLEAYIKRNNSL